MGYYIETGGNHGKAEAIADQFGGYILTSPPDYDTLNDQGFGIIVVIDNEIFEAAGFAYDKQEYEVFTNPADMRRKKFVVARREDLEKASGFSR